MSNRLYYQSMQEVDSYFFPQFQSLDHQLCAASVRKRPHIAKKIYDSSYCTLESSPALISFSSNDKRYSPDNTYSSPISSSCITDDASDLRYKLMELENVMLGPDFDVLDSHDSTYQIGTENPDPESLGQIMDSISKGDLKKVLISCAKAVSDNNSVEAQWLVDELRKMVSVSGEPMQRLGAYMLEGLVARLSSSGSCIYKALRCKEPASNELFSYKHTLYEACPYFKFGYMSANGAIAEAMKNEDRVHIIDFQIAQGSQWITLIQAFAARPGGPPHIKITGMDDSMSANARRRRGLGLGLGIVGKQLSKLAESFKVPFEFCTAAMSGSEVQLENLGVQPGEAVAVNFAFILHHVPDESVSTENHRDKLLRLVKSLSPKVVTLVEQESNTNTATFYARFGEALDYYNAMFESIDATFPREHKERINIEQHCLAREVVNIIACEGPERVERHELLGKWRSRFRMAGFFPYPLSSLVNSTIKKLLENYCNRYRIEEREGALFLGWMNRNLVASCAWQ